MNKAGAVVFFVAMLALPFVGNAADVSQSDVTGAIGEEAHNPGAMPVFDLMQNCASAFTSREAVGNCIAREEGARKRLLSSWETLSARVKNICLARVPAGGQAYFSLADCTLKEGRLDRLRTTVSQAINAD